MLPSILSQVFCVCGIVIRSHHCLALSVASLVDTNKVKLSKLWSAGKSCQSFWQLVKAFKAVDKVLKSVKKEFGTLNALTNCAFGNVRLLLCQSVFWIVIHLSLCLSPLSISVLNCHPSFPGILSCPLLWLWWSCLIPKWLFSSIEKEDVKVLLYLFLSKKWFLAFRKRERWMVF